MRPELERELLDADGLAALLAVLVPTVRVRPEVDVLPHGSPRGLDDVPVRGLPLRDLQPSAVEAHDRDELAAVLRGDRVPAQLLHLVECDRALLLAVGEPHREVGLALAAVNLRDVLGAEEHSLLRLVALRVLHVEAPLQVIGERDARHVLELSLDVQDQEHHLACRSAPGEVTAASTATRFWLKFIHPRS